MKRNAFVPTIFKNFSQPREISPKIYNRRNPRTTTPSFLSQMGDEVSVESNQKQRMKKNFGHE